MQKFLSKPPEVVDVTRSYKIDLATVTAKQLIDATLEGVPLDDKMKTMGNLQTLLQESSQYLSELMKIESRRIVVDCR